VTVVTALRSAGRGGKVRVELDGEPWRTLPLEVVVRAGLAAGRVLERPQLRLLRRELRRHEALRASTGALRHRDLSASELEERLRRRDVAPAEREDAIATLRSAGLVDDERLACSRATTAMRRSGSTCAAAGSREPRSMAHSPRSSRSPSARRESSRGVGEAWRPLACSHGVASARTSSRRPWPPRLARRTRGRYDSDCIIQRFACIAFFS
jgi:hypothetical protein